MSYHHDSYYHYNGYYLAKFIGILLVFGIIITCWSLVAAFPPLFLFALYFLNNRADKAPKRSLQDMFKAHPVVFVVGAIDCVTAVVFYFTDGCLRSLVKTSTLSTEELAKSFSYILCSTVKSISTYTLIFVGMLLTVMVVEAYIRAR